MEKTYLLDAFGLYKRLREVSSQDPSFLIANSTTNRCSMAIEQTGNGRKGGFVL